jgi:hypothetical protein
MNLSKKLLAPLGYAALVSGLAIAVAMTAGADAADKTERSLTDFASTLDDEMLLLAQGQEFIPTDKPFNHESHLGKKATERNGGTALDCADCHDAVQSDGTCPKGDVKLPPHEACAKCHAANFYTPPLNICTACHESAEFKKDNKLKVREGRSASPRKANFNHKLHLIAKGKARKMTGKKLDCTSCHKVKKKGKAVTAPRHPTCCECHTDPKLKVTMNKCSSCHNVAKGAGRPTSKIHSFTHAKHHRTSKDGGSLACKTCHVNGHKAQTLRQIKIPPMPVCVQCHDGQHTWHFSSCLKCHKQGSISGPLPPSHPTAPAPEGAKK